jgi:restriction system protein
MLNPLHLERPRLGRLLDRLNDRIARAQGTASIELDRDNVKALSWREVQNLVAGAFRRQGYGVRPFAGGESPVDLVLRKDGEETFVSCKHWKVWEVGHQPLAELYGYMDGAGAHRAVMLTTGNFTERAHTFAARHNLRLVLIDGPGIFDLVHGTP